MMWFFDTNILVYSIVSVDEAKMHHSQALISDSIQSNKFLISPISLQELIFVLAKLKVGKEVLRKAFHSFFRYCLFEVDAAIIKNAFELCDKIDFCRNVNDAIHLKYAEKYCDKLLTFDGDFRKFIPHSELEIEIIDANSLRDF